MTPRLYKAADVCEMTQVQPYVLRSWEKEFPGIGVQRSADSPRVYRQSDVDQVLRIKQLVFGEGLTLAGARRRLEGQAPAPRVESDADRAEVFETLGADARAKIASVRSGLRLLLDALSHAPGVVPIPQAAINGGSALPRAEVVAPAASAMDRLGPEPYELRPPAPKARVAKPAPVKARAIASRGKPAARAANPARRSKSSSPPKRKRASA